MKKSQIINYLLPGCFALSVLLISLVNIPNLKSNYDALVKTAEEKNIPIQTTLANLEKEYAKDFKATDNFVDINGGWARLMDQPLLNERLKLQNGNMTDLMDEKDATSKAKIITYLKDYLAMRDVPFAYVQLPIVYLTDDDPMLPDWVDTYANRNVDGILSQLEKNGVKTYDVREEMIAENINSYDAFFKTDHHWKIETGLWAHTKFVSYIQNVLGDDIAINEKALDLDNYTYTTYKDFHLGSHGNRTGGLYAGCDDITCIVPAFSTDVRLEIPVADYNERGAFEDVVVNPKDKIDWNKHYTETYGWMYFYTTPEYLKLTNYNSPNDIKVFLIGDSFSQPMTPFLSQHFKEVHMYDLRDGDAETLLSLLDEVQPDIVLNSYYPNTNFNEGANKFLTKDAKKEVDEYRKEQKK